MEPVIFSRKTKNIKKKSQTISNNLKKSQKISRYLKISLMLFLKRGFARLGSLLLIFLDHRKSQKISKSFKKSQNLSDLQEKTKNKKKTK
jgi:hypothetical protein